MGRMGADVDGEKVKNELKKRGMSLASASLALGYSDGAISAAINYGRMSEVMLIGLKSQFGIDREKIMPDKPVLKSAEAVNVPTPAMMQEIYLTIYNAVKNGVRDALNEEGK